MLKLQNCSCETTARTDGVWLCRDMARLGRGRTAGTVKQGRVAEDVRGREGSKESEEGRD